MKKPIEMTLGEIETIGLLRHDAALLDLVYNVRDHLLTEYARISVYVAKPIPKAVVKPSANKRKQKYIDREIDSVPCVVVE